MAGDGRLENSRLDPIDLLRWWHQYQAQMLNEETDFIRNGLLQEIIALRRQLEMSCHAEVDLEGSNCELHLAAMKRLYTLAEDFCDRLQSPYLQDSLPLALQHAVHPWKDAFNIRVTVPTVWICGQVEHTRLLILLIKTLVQQLTEADRLPQQLTLNLEERDGSKQLRIDAQYGALQSSAFWQTVQRSLAPFLQTFQLFTEGSYQQLFQGDSLSLKLSWAVPTQIVT